MCNSKDADKNKHLPAYQLGAALAEYIPILGAIVLVASISFGQLGETTQQQGANIATELGGGNGSSVQLASNSGPNIPPGPSAVTGTPSSGSTNSSGSGNTNNNNNSSAGSQPPSSGTPSAGGNNTGGGAASSGGNSGAGSNGTGNNTAGTGNNSGGNTQPPVEEDPPLLSVDGLIAFGQGFWEGARAQGEGLWQMIRHPIQTVESFYTLGRALIEDPSAVFAAIQQEIGEDLESIVSGDAREIGRILGENVNPAAVLNVARRVAHIARRVDDGGRTDVSGCTRRSSFSGDTLVWTENGHKAIQDIQVGDAVWSRNDKTFEDSYRKVTELLTREVDHYYEVTVQRHTIKTTEEHPFWQQGAGWIAAQNLVPGETLAAATGDLTLRSIERIDQRLTVYNLVVETDHTYFVSQFGMWVHNQGDGPGCTLADNIDGPGRWESETGLNPREAAYQSQVTGVPEGQQYILSDPNVPSGQTSFDGYNANTNTLLDAKCWTCWPIDTQFSIDSVVDQARRQQRIAQDVGSSVEWHVPSQEVADRVQSAFNTVAVTDDPIINIRIVVTPE